MVKRTSITFISVSTYVSFLVCILVTLYSVYLFVDYVAFLLTMFTAYMQVSKSPSMIRIPANYIPYSYEYSMIFSLFNCLVECVITPSLLLCYERGSNISFVNIYIYIYIYIYI